MALFAGKQKSTANNQVTVVSGLPRSGTSMLMKMLEAGGLDPLTDEIRKADDDNPKGYYEFERVKKLETEKDWLPEAKGKAVKIISMLLQYLPPDYTYKVIFIKRHIPEVLASQNQMLIRLGAPTGKVPDEEIGRMYEKHLIQTETWLRQQPAFDVLYVNHHDIIKNPVKSGKKINKFLGGHLDVKKMSEVVDNTLYRQQQQ